MYRPRYNNTNSGIQFKDLAVLKNVSFSIGVNFSCGKCKYYNQLTIQKWTSYIYFNIYNRLLLLYSSTACFNLCEHGKCIDELNNWSIIWIVKVPSNTITSINMGHSIKIIVIYHTAQWMISHYSKFRLHFTLLILL